MSISRGVGSSGGEDILISRGGYFLKNHLRMILQVVKDILWIFTSFITWKIHLLKPYTFVTVFLLEISDMKDICVYVKCNKANKILKGE